MQLVVDVALCIMMFATTCLVMSATSQCQPVGAVGNAKTAVHVPVVLVVKSPAVAPPCWAEIVPQPVIVGGEPDAARPVAEVTIHVGPRSINVRVTVEPTGTYIGVL